MGLFGLFGTILLLSACEAETPRPPIVEDGSIDLSQWDFARGGPVKLNGQWRYFPLELRNSVSAENAEGLLTDVPAAWGDEALPEGERKGAGYATYALNIISPAGAPDLGLETWTLSSAYAVFVDGRLISEVGTVGTTRASHVPQYFPQIVELPRATDAMQVVIQVSNYEHVRGGLWPSISVGPLEDLRRSRELRLGIALFLTGASVMIGLYHLMVWTLRRSELPYLAFALICVSLGGRILTTNDTYLRLVFDALPFGAQLRIEYLFMVFTYLFSWLFIRLVFPHEAGRVITALFVVPICLYGLMVTFLPIYHFTSFLPAFQGLVLLGVFVVPSLIVFAAFRGREGAKAFAASIFLLVFLVLYDLRVSLFPQLATIQLFGADMLLLPAGYFAFILTQAALLARRSAKAMNQIRVRGEQLAEAHRRIDLHAQELEQAVITRTAELAEANEKLARMSLVDELTQLANRRAFNQELERHWADHRRRKAPMSVVMIDVDYFKRFNDRYGHLEGDKALTAVATAIRQSVNRPRDFAARVGGEEMAVLLADTDEEGAVHVAERVRKAVEATGKPHQDSEFGTVTVSSGVAARIPDGSSMASQLVSDADAALYRAKAMGRNRVEV